VRSLSPAFCAWAIERFNEDPEAAGAARGWTWDFGVVIDSEAGPSGYYVGAPVGGRLPAPEPLALAELEGRRPTYFARASEADWLALIDGALDPILAVVQKRLVVRGDLTPVVARLNYKGLAERWLDALRRGERS
jgi:hypothetical protein